MSDAVQKQDAPETAFDPSKPYCTRGGRIAIIQGKDRSGLYFGIIGDEEMLWDCNGHSFEDQRKHPDDLVNFAPPPAVNAHDAEAKPYPSAKLRDATPLHLTYTNWRGETSVRRIVPLAAPHLGTTDWHSEPGWLWRVFDCDKQAEREFALSSFACVAPQSTPASPASSGTGDGWQTMESAPKDGCWLIGREGEAAHRCRWIPDQDEGGFYDHAGQFLDLDHWAPEPSSPSTTTDATKPAADGEEDAAFVERMWRKPLSLWVPVDKERMIAIARLGARATSRTGEVSEAYRAGMLRAAAIVLEQQPSDAVRHDPGRTDLRTWADVCRAQTDALHRAAQAITREEIPAHRISSNTELQAASRVFHHNACTLGKLDAGLVSRALYYGLEPALKAATRARRSPSPATTDTTGRQQP